MLPEGSADGATLAADDISGVLHQRVKIQHGGDGSATDVSSASPLPVTAASLPLPSGAATSANQTTELAHLAAIETAVEGTLAVSAASLPLPSGAATSALQGTANTALAAIQTAVEALDNAVAGSELQVDLVGSVPAGSNEIGRVRLTDGTDLASITAAGRLEVDGSGVTQPVSAASLPLPSGAATSANQTTELAHLAAIEAAVEGTLTVGTHAVTQSGTWGVRCQDGSGNALTSKVAGSERAMSVAIVDGSGTHITSFGGGTQYTEGDTDATITGTAMLWEDTGNTLRPVASGTPLPVAIISGAGSGGTAIQDGAAFTADTTSLTPIGGYRDDTSPATVTEGDAAAARITEYRALHVNLRDASGSEVSVGGGTQYDEDTASASAEKLTMAGVVRSDTASSKVSDDGDRTVLLVDSSGRLHVNVGNTVTVASHAVTQSGTWTLGANSGVDIGDVTINNASGASAVNVQDGGNSLTVDDGNSSLNIDNAALSVTGGGAEATALRVTIANDSTGVVSVDDNGSTLSVDDGGSSITVDNGGTFAVQVTSLPASTNTIEVVGDAAHDAAASGNPVLVGAYASATAPSDVADADAVRIWADRAGRVQVGDGGGSLTVDGSVTVSGTVTANAGTNLNTSALALESGGNLAAAATSLGLLDNAVSGNELQVDIVAALPSGTNNIGDVDVLTLPGVAGTVAHDSADSGNPVKVGFQAVNALPTAVANGDRVNGVADLFGRQMVAFVDPAMQAWKSGNYTTSQTGTALWTPASGKRIAISSIVISAYGTTAGRVLIWLGSGADTTYTAGTDQLVLPFNAAPGDSSKPGVSFTPTVPIYCTTADHVLRVTTDAAISIDVIVNGWEW